MLHNPYIGAGGANNDVAVEMQNRVYSDESVAQGTAYQQDKDGAMATSDRGLQADDRRDSVTLVDAYGQGHNMLVMSAPLHVQGPGGTNLIGAMQDPAGVDNDDGIEREMERDRMTPGGEFGLAVQGVFGRNAENGSAEMDSLHDNSGGNTTATENSRVDASTLAQIIGDISRFLSNG